MSTDIAVFSVEGSEGEISPLDFQVAGRRYYQFRRDRHYWLQYTEWYVRPHLLRFSNSDRFSPVLPNLSCATPIHSLFMDKDKETKIREIREIR